MEATSPTVDEIELSKLMLSKAIAAEIGDRELDEEIGDINSDVAELLPHDASRIWKEHLEPLYYAAQELAYTLEELEPEAA